MENARARKCPKARVQMDGGRLTAFSRDRLRLWRGPVASSTSRVHRASIARAQSFAAVRARRRIASDLRLRPFVFVAVRFGMIS